MNAEVPLSGTTVCYPLSVSPAFTLERALEGFSRVGLRFVELVAIPDYCPHLVPNQMVETDIKKTKDLLAQYGLIPIALNVAADLTTEPGIAFLGHAARVASALGIRTVVTAIEQTEEEGNAARFMNFLPRIIAQAETYDVCIALETHGGLIGTGVQGVQLLEKIGSERLKLTYDMANVVYYAGIRPEQDLLEMGKQIGRYTAHVHLKDKANLQLRDYNFPAFGRGVLDFRRVIQLLRAGNYRGPMTLEVELDGQPSSPEIVDEAILESYRYLQPLLEASPTIPEKAPQA
jgi:L-ribulose-5-phosphate 3-epimerase